MVRYAFVPQDLGGSLLFQKPRSILHDLACAARNQAFHNESLDVVPHPILAIRSLDHQHLRLSFFKGDLPMDQKGWDCGQEASQP